MSKVIEIDRQLVQTVIDKLFEHADKNWPDYVDEDGSFCIDLESALERVVEETLGNRYENGHTEAQFDRIYHHPLVGEAVYEMKVIVKQNLKDHKAWERAQQSPEAMLRYHGMSMSDFI